MLEYTYGNIEFSPEEGIMRKTIDNDERLDILKEAKLKAKKRQLTRISMKDQEQTVLFWNLQLQFMAMSTEDLVDLFLSLNSYFNRTKHVKKSYRKCLKWLSDYNLFDLNQDERNCIATTIAIQLSGLA